MNLMKESILDIFGDIFRRFGFGVSWLHSMGIHAAPTAFVFYNHHGLAFDFFGANCVSRLLPQNSLCFGEGTR